MCLRAARAAMGAARLRAVALDMDGTALNSAHALTQGTVEAIRRAEAAGVRVIIATGRPAMSLQPFVDQLALPGPLPAVCFNGACAALLRAGAPGPESVLFTQGLAPEAARRVLALADQRGWCASCCHPARSVAAPRSDKQERLLAAYEGMEGLRQARAASSGELLAVGEAPLKIVCLSSDPDGDAAAARQALPEGLVHVIAAEQHVEFVDPGVSKGLTLERLCGTLLGTPLEQVVAFGDNHNDEDMLRLVGEGVAMSNAKESVKAAAARSSEWSNDEEGVARELRALLDSGELAGPPGEE